MTREYQRYRRTRRYEKPSPYLIWGVPLGLLLVVLVLGSVGVSMYHAWQRQTASATPTTAQASPTPATTRAIPPPPWITPGQPRPELLAPPPNQPIIPASEPEEDPKPYKRPSRTPAEDGYFLQEKERNFTAKNGMYTAHMPPGERSRDIQKILNVGEITIPFEGAEVESGSNTYMAISMGIPAALMREIAVEDRCDMICDGLFKSKGGKLVGKKLIRQDRVAGKEYLVELDDAAARLQVFTISGWVVMAVVEGKDMDTVRSKDADNFLSGVKLSDQAKKLYAQVSR